MKCFIPFMLCGYQIQVCLVLFHGGLCAPFIFVSDLIRGEQLIPNFGDVKAVLSIHNPAFVSYFLKTDIFLELDEPLLRFSERFLCLPNLNIGLLSLELDIYFRLLQTCFEQIVSRLAPVPN